MTILIKILGIFLFLLPFFAQQQKIEVVLTVEDQENPPNFNIVHKNDSSFEIITNHSFPIKSFSMKLVGSLKFSDSKVLYIINEPNISTHIYRCIKKAELNQNYKENFSHFSTFDNFGKDFDNYFKKKSFEVNLPDFEDKMSSFNCRGIRLDNRDHKWDISQNLNFILEFLVKELFSEKNSSLNEKSIVSLKKIFELSQKYDNFMIKTSIVNEKIDSFSIEATPQKSLIWPANLNISSFFLLKNSYNTFRIHHLKNNLAYPILYTLTSNNNSKNQELIPINEKRNFFSQYSSSYKKNVQGSGLHQKTILNFTLKGSQTHFSKEIIKGKCSLLIIDYLDDTNYIDIEEMINDSNYKLITYNVIDIEKPSQVSSQHMYMIKYPIKPENKLFGENNVTISISLEYPLHFRYRKPHHELTYKKSFVNQKPEFYFDCMTLNYYMNRTIPNFNDIFVFGTVSKVMSRIYSSSDNNDEENLIRLIPNGDLNHLPFILISTLAVTLCAAFFIGWKILEKK